MAFPNVPNAPGVPALIRAAGSIAAAPDDLLTSDSTTLFAGQEAPLWGLFLDGVPVITAETVVSFEFKQGYAIANFPVEEGGFESYDKVQRPFDVRLRFATGDTPAARAALIASARAACASLDLMDAVTPVATYENVNPTNFDYRQTATNGVGLIVVDVFCEEVRSTAKSSFTNGQQQNATTGSTDTGTGQMVGVSIRPTATINAPQSPSASPVVNDGTVQPVTAGTGQFDLSQALP